MKKLDFHTLARQVADKEGGVEQNIAQINEATSIVINLLADHLETGPGGAVDVLDFISRRGKREQN